MFGRHFRTFEFTLLPYFLFVYCLSELYWTVTYGSEKVLTSKKVHGIEKRFPIIEGIKRFASKA